MRGGGCGNDEGEIDCIFEKVGQKKSLGDVKTPALKQGK